MRITHVAIENWRSIRELEFQPSPLCAIVGPNNAGKSNILSALDLLLGPRYPTDGSFDRSDHHRFEDAWPRISATFSYLDELPSQQSMRFEFGFVPQYGMRLKYWGEGEQGRFANSAIRERFGLVRLGVDRGTWQHRPTNRWTLLGRLLQSVNEEFRGDPTRMVEFDTTINHLMDNVLSGVPRFAQLRKTLREEAARQLHRTVEDVGVDFSLRDPWSFYRTLQLVVKECGIETRADQSGMGLQSSLMLAMVRAYAKIAHEDRAVIAIEEPELFLHPLAARQYYRLMRELAYPTDGSLALQIIYTTHSASMIDFEHFDEVVLVRKRPTKDGWGTRVTQVSLKSVLDDLSVSSPTKENGEPTVRDDASEEGLRAHLAATYDPSRSEGIFASVVVLVEGPTETLSLPVYAKTMGVDFDLLNVAVIAAGGKGGLPGLLRTFTKFQIPCYVLADGDSHKTPPNDRVDLNAQLATLTGTTLPTPHGPVVGSRLALWQKDYEDAIRETTTDYTQMEEEARGLGTSKPSVARYCALKLQKQGAVPGPIREIVEAIERIATKNYEASATAPGETEHAVPDAEDRDATDWERDDDGLPF